MRRRIRRGGDLQGGVICRRCNAKAVNLAGGELRCGEIGAVIVSAKISEAVKCGAPVLTPLQHEEFDKQPGRAVALSSGVVANLELEERSEVLFPSSPLPSPAFKPPYSRSTIQTNCGAHVMCAHLLFVKQLQSEILLDRT